MNDARISISKADPTDKVVGVKKSRAAAEDPKDVKLKQKIDADRAQLAELKKQQSADIAKIVRHVAHAQGWKAVCIEPDFCKIGKSVVAFDSFATLDNRLTASPNVIARGTPVYRKNDLIKGVQADAGQHVVAGTSLGSGHVKILEGHKNVKANGIPVALHNSHCLINCDATGKGGAKGKLVTEEKSATSPSSRATNPDAPPGQRTSEKLKAKQAELAQRESGQWDLNALDEYVNFKDANATLNDAIGGIQGTPGTIGDYAAQATRGVLGFGKDIVTGVGELAYEGIKAVPKLARSQLTTNGQAISNLKLEILAENIKLGNITSGTIGQDALNIGKAIVKPVTDPWAKGQYVEAVTRGAAEVGTIFIGSIKAVNGVKVGSAAEAIKAAEAAAQAAKAAKAEQASGAAKGLDEGVHVKFRGKIKYRTAKDANEELIDLKRATKETAPFKEGTMVTERNMVPGEKFSMAVDEDQLIKLRNPNIQEGVGGWGTTDTFVNQSEALNKMAINPNWKPNGIPYSVEFEVVKPFRTLEGIAGPQGSLPGGAQQSFLDLPRNAGKEFVRIVNVKTVPGP